MRQRRASRSLKRFVDIAAAGIALVVLSPLMALIALAIRCTSPGSVIFRQVRPGFNGQFFVLLKFRTMRPSRPDEDPALTDGMRVTRLGIFLRKTSLDELPQLWNVIRGDLSLVGPRPLLVRYTPYFTPRELLRHSVLPGITGWAQVHGRNLASWDTRLEYDVWYVENWSLMLDMKILLLTAATFLRSGDVIVDARSKMLNLDEERRSS